jgi:hypothetical protein
MALRTMAKPARTTKRPRNSKMSMRRRRVTSWNMKYM